MLAISPLDEYVPKLKSWGLTHAPVELDGSGLNPVKDFSYLKQLKRILKAERPDIILSYTIKANIYGAIAAKSLRIPIISNVSGLGTTFLWKGWIRMVVIMLYNRAFAGASFIFFQNADDRKLFLQNVKVNASKTGLLPGSGIDLSYFKTDSPTFGDSIKFLMISRLLLEKGVLEYLDAADRVLENRKDVEFQFLGKYEPDHKRAIDKEDFNRIKKSNTITYLGHSDNVKQHIESADVVILPSYREGTPRTLLEAAAMSRPIIATDVPGCREVVLDGTNGFLCEVRNPKSLAQKIALLLALSQEEKKAMARASRKLVEERFDEQIVIAEYSRKIKQLLS